ncbi:MAG: flavodoxin domain-containing protein, partial [Methylococcales bacterium]
MKIPQLLHDAPYSEAQRAWLSGFFTGIYTHGIQNAGVNSSATVSTVHILYGSQTGTAESVANDAAAMAKTQGLKAVVNSMDAIDSIAFVTMDTVLIVTSTYGEGEMPDNASVLWEAVNADTMPRLEKLQYSVLALGDTS